MPWFNEDDSSEHYRAYEEVRSAPHKAHLSHELLAAAASFAAAKAYEDHCRKHGKPANHAAAMELLAAFGGAFIDREIETKGLDYMDRNKVREHANRHSRHHVADREYDY